MVDYTKQFEQGASAAINPSEPSTSSTTVIRPFDILMGAALFLAFIAAEFALAYAYCLCNNGRGRVSFLAVMIYAAAPGLFAMWSYRRMNLKNWALAGLISLVLALCAEYANWLMYVYMRTAELMWNPVDLFDTAQCWAESSRNELKVFEYGLEAVFILVFPHVVFCYFHNKRVYCEKCGLWMRGELAVTLVMTLPALRKLLRDSGVLPCDAKLGEDRAPSETPQVPEPYEIHVWYCKDCQAGNVSVCKKVKRNKKRTDSIPVPGLQQIALDPDQTAAALECFDEASRS